MLEHTLSLKESWKWIHRFRDQFLRAMCQDIGTEITTSVRETAPNLQAPMQLGSHRAGPTNAKIESRSYRSFSNPHVPKSVKEKRNQKHPYKPVMSLQP